MRAPALFRQVRAFLTGYFWRPCPLCGDYFAGYEWTEPDQSIPKPSGGGTAVCRACIPEARTMTALAEMTPEQQERIRQAVLADDEFMLGVHHGLEEWWAGGQGTAWSVVKKELGIE